MIQTRQDLLIVSVAHHESDEKLDSLMRVMAKARKNNIKHIVCLIDCNDPRDVWECPECNVICKRLVDCGFISFLNVAVSIVMSGYDKTLANSLGAFEVWKISEGLLGGRSEFYDQGAFEKLWNRFTNVLGESNNKSEHLLAEV